MHQLKTQHDTPSVQKLLKILQSTYCTDLVYHAHRSHLVPATR